MMGRRAVTLGATNSGGVEGAGVTALLDGRLLPILLIADLLHPVDGFAVEIFVDSNVRHCSRRCSSVPMLFTGRKPNNVTWPDLLNRIAFTLHPPVSRCDNQCLA